MDLIWPWNLTFLLLIPLIVAVYLWMLRRKQRYAVRYSSLSLIREAMPRHSRWRRHLPFALFTAALAGLLMGMTRPTAEIELPMNKANIILAMDVSRSMCASDVEPNRLTVAQEAASAFIEDQPGDTRIGIVAFADFAETVVEPTADKEVLTEAVENFTTSLGTAIGSAILKSIDAIAVNNDNVALSGVNLQAGLSEEGTPDGDAPSPTLDGVYQPDIIVLLTDGANSRGPLPLDAAQQAADRGIRVYTIGFGTTNPGAMVCTRAQLGGDLFRGGGGGFPGGFSGGGGGGGGGMRRFIVLDEPTLRGVAELTGGAYFQAENADQLLDVFMNLPSHVVMQKESREISVFFAGLAALLATSAVFLSLRWNRYP
ncbi:MAG: VWA domain-containing protein [Caldilineaceae bacterium]|nr:VWA domain-containing protein [Caldilineaceae bacterium]